MKEHFQDYGVRKWAGDDLIELQSEPLAALQALVSPYAPCIISGCKVKADDEGGYTVSAGLVALAGKDVKGEDCVKIVRAAGITMADNNQVCYLTLQHQTLTRTYKDGTSKAIAYDYTAQQTTSKPVDEPYLEISVDGSRRLADALEITQKLDREGGEAKNVKVTFADPVPEQKPETLKSNAKLGTLISQIKGWLSALKTLAFKEKVSKDDLDADLTKELNDKVDKVAGKGLSTNDFTNALKSKLNGFTHAAGGDLEGDYPNPTIRDSVVLNGEPAVNGNLIVFSEDSDYGNLCLAHSDGSSGRIILGDGSTYIMRNENSELEINSDGPIVLNSAGGIYDFQNGDLLATQEYVTTSITKNKYTHPTTEGNKHIPKGGESGQYLKWLAKGTATWAKPTASEIGAATSSHTHTPASIGAASTAIATTSANGLMSAADKTKLDKIDISISGNKLTFTWKSNITASGVTSANPITYTATLSGSSSSSLPGGGLVTQP